MGDSEQNVLTGVQLIESERERQVSLEGWTPEHDDEHKAGELAVAAVCYARHSAFLTAGVRIRQNIPFWWPWENDWWKPSDDPIRNLAKAGALIAAEIDRLQREQREVTA